MSRRLSTSPPAYRLHKQSGHAVVTLRDPGNGRRPDILLGKHGTSDSRQEYARVIAEWEAACRLVAPAISPGGNPTGFADRPPPDLTVNEVLAAFLRLCETSCVTDRKPSSEQRETKLVMVALKKPYGHSLARDFNPLSLKAVRQKKPRKLPGEHHATQSCHEAIQHACERAKVPHWHPHQLRHSHATDVVRRHFGTEAAQVVLGHASAQVTQIYDERDLRLAMKIAETEG